MVKGWLFKKALLLVSGLSAMPYLTWPVFILASSILLFNKFRPILAWQTTLLVVWWVLIVIGIALVVTLLIAFFAVPKNDQVANTMMYIAFIASLPILVPCVVAFFCKPIPV